MHPIWLWWQAKNDKIVEKERKKIKIHEKFSFFFFLFSSPKQWRKKFHNKKLTICDAALEIRRIGNYMSAVCRFLLSFFPNFLLWLIKFMLFDKIQLFYWDNALFFLLLNFLHMVAHKVAQVEMYTVQITVQTCCVCALACLSPRNDTRKSNLVHLRWIETSAKHRLDTAHILNVTLLLLLLRSKLYFCIRYEYQWHLVFNRAEHMNTTHTHTHTLWLSISIHFIVTSYNKVNP